MQMLECGEDNMHSCLTPMIFLLMSGTSPHPPSHPFYPVPIPLQPPFSPHRVGKVLSLEERRALAPLMLL
jgi:hypothetical protein